MAASSDLAHVFVYGTLKRMQCRGNAWPRTPVEVQVAFTLGQLYDLGPYPAMTAGKDIVSGELWSFRPDDITATIKVLDEIEGVSHGMYERVEVNCWLAEAEHREPKCSAYTYHYRLDLDVANRLPPRSPSEFCVWP